MNIASTTHSPNFLQVSSEIIGKHRYCSDVTGMTNINSSLSLDRRSTKGRKYHFGFRGFSNAAPKEIHDLEMRPYARFSLPPDLVSKPLDVFKEI
jgi:hypothetical protein